MSKIIGRYDYSKYNKKPNFHWTDNDHKVVDDFYKDGFDRQQKDILKLANPKDPRPFAYQKVFDRLKSNPKYVRSIVFDMNKNDPKPTPTFYYNQEATELIIQEIHRIDNEV